MTRLKCADSEDPLVPRWSTISGSSMFWTERPLSGEYLRGALHPALAKQVYKCSSEELMNRNDRALLEGDVLSLIKAAAFLEAELKVEDQKAVAAYKASQGFESSLKKIGRVSYKFRYRVALERLRGKHHDITIERDPFAECSEDANVEMDLDKPFDDGTPL
ncbi:hypothetical protein BHE74_00055986 [Ensete ventricosum]|uniref:Uncharacterized protein n=1 Tax=Ensete ventricosum TaxID=4639 RepID=A0A445MMR4_ENSVE|nr:hypothetical protein BHE74_00055986 [Ensete ventricosum]RZR75529.1 hypothetical protein BHM03_00060293 [Ensete ventricosum]